MVRRFLGGVLGGAALFAAACGLQASRGYPLYRKLGDGPGPDGVATLYGPIQSVDGQDVSHKGQTFELLPGCHVVTLQRNIGEGSANGAWAANLPPLTVAFQMKPAHRYAIASDMTTRAGRSAASPSSRARRRRTARPSASLSRAAKTTS